MRLLAQCSLVMALICVCSCKAHTPSGAYLNRGEDFVELLQITAKSDGNLEGTLTHTKLETDGTLSQKSVPLEGVTDGSTITISLKHPLSPLPSSNSSGTIEGGMITLFLEDSSATYTASKPEAYQAALQEMKAKSLAIRELLRIKRENQEKQKRIETENASVASANKALNAFAIEIRKSRNEKMLEIFHSTHAHALKSARSALQAQKEFPPQSIQASQINVDINQIEVGLMTYDHEWEAHSKAIRVRLQELDQVISTSPCRNLDMPLISCTVQLEAIRAYQAGKTIAERQSSDIDATLEADHAAIEAIARESDGYLR